MNITGLFLLWSALICLQLTEVVSSGRHRAKTFVIKRAQLLLQHVTEETYADNVRRCAVRCLEHQCCHSLNYHGATHRCLLTNAAGKDLVSESVTGDGWLLVVEYPLEQCVTNPCLNNAACSSTCIEGEETITCHCVAGTFGRRCHILQECNMALGMESTTIPDASVTASSSKDDTHLPHRARLNLPAASWAADAGDTDPWLKVELLILANVTGVVTQGSGQSGGGWVTKFKLSYTDTTDGTTQVHYKDYSGEEKIFSGNKDISSEVKQFLDPIIWTRSLTVWILEWNEACSARVEIIGCYVEDTDWLLAFKGRAETGLSIYNAWTNLGDDPTQVEADRALTSSHHYRNNILYHLWDSLPINEVKLSLYMLNPVNECLVMRFDGAGSDVENWFATSRILESPWTDFHQGASPHIASMEGHPQSQRRFLFDFCVYNTCAGDCGWLVVTECAASCACDWEGTLHGKTVASSIIYCNKTTRCSWYSADIRLADALTIHVKL